MNTDETMTRLRAARPTAAESEDHAALFAQIVTEPGDPRLAGAAREPTGLRFMSRPRVLAGGTLGGAAVAVAATLALSAGSASPAFAVTREADGTVLVTLSNPHAIAAADRQLASMGIDEQVDYQLASGPASSSSPVACKLVRDPASGTVIRPGAKLLAASSGATPPARGTAKTAPAPTGPPVTMRLGADGTATLPAAEANTAEPSGTVHLAGCISYPEPASVVRSENGDFGNTGQ